MPLPIPPRIRAFAFDMDGTLLDSMPYWRRLNTDFLTARGLAAPDEIRADLDHISNRVCAAQYAEMEGVAMSFEDIIREYCARMAVYYQHDVQPKPNAARFVRMLREKGYRVCVATASTPELACPALARHGMLDDFEFVLSEKEIGIKKDKPAFYQVVADRFGLPVTACAMFEDSPYAMRAAREAGMAVFGIREAVHRLPPGEAEALCDVFVDNYAELLDD